MGNDFKSRLRNLQKLHKEYMENNPILDVFFKDGRVEYLTEHEVIIAAIKYADSIDHIEGINGSRVAELVNALIAV